MAYSRRGRPMTTRAGEQVEEVEEEQTTSPTVLAAERQALSTGGAKAKFSATKEELRARLSPIQYQVTQLRSTERPGSGEYNKFKKEGIYHCVVCDEQLFSSKAKFDSGCGWPAFFGAIDQGRLKFVQDFGLVGGANLLRLTEKSNQIRLEVLCLNCGAHLGHRFDDGPLSKGGKRYCINSAALKFVEAPLVETTKASHE